MRRATLACVVVVVTGCDNLFGLHELLPPTGHPTADAGPDAGDPPADANVDAPPGLPDEDGDGKPDVTDNCPTVANSGQGDDDMDGVGNVCDPQPDIAGESQLFFDGFDPVAAPLNCADGTWSVQAGQLVQTDVAVSHPFGICAFPIPSTTGHYTVVAKLHVTGTYSGNSMTSDGRAVGVWLDVPLAPSPALPANGVSCEYSQVFDNSTTVPLAFRALDRNLGSTLMTNRYQAPDTPTTATIVATHDNTQGQQPVHCIETVQHFDFVEAARTSGSTHHFGVRVANLAVAFDYVWAYETTAP